MTGFSDLPGHVIGYLFEHLDDDDTKRALFLATPAVRFEESVLSKYPQQLRIMLPIPPHNAHKYPSSLRFGVGKDIPLPVLEFPRGANLRKLTVFGWEGLPDDAPSLLFLLSSQNRILLQSLETLVLQYNDVGQEEADEVEDSEAAVGMALRSHCTSLKTLELHGPFVGGGLLRALKGCLTLKELHIHMRASLPKFLPMTIPIGSISTMHNLQRLTIPGTGSFIQLCSLQQLKWLSVGAPFANDFSIFLQDCPTLDALVIGNPPRQPVSSPFLKFLTMETVCIHSLTSFFASAYLPSLKYLEVENLQIQPGASTSDVIAAAKSQLAVMSGVVIEVGRFQAGLMVGSQIVEVLEPFANRICISGSSSCINDVLFVDVTLAAGDVCKIAKLLLPGTSSISLLNCTLSTTSLLEVAESFGTSLTRLEWAAGPMDFKSESHQIWGACSIFQSQSARNLPCEFLLNADPLFGRGGQWEDANRVKAMVNVWCKQLAAFGKAKVCLKYVDELYNLNNMLINVDLSAALSGLLPALEATVLGSL